MFDNTATHLIHPNHAEFGVGYCGWLTNLHLNGPSDTIGVLRVEETTCEFCLNILNGNYDLDDYILNMED